MLSQLVLPSAPLAFSKHLSVASHFEAGKTSKAPFGSRRNAAPVPKKVPVLTAAEEVEYDATEFKFSKSILHMTLNSFIYLLIQFPAH